MRPATRGALTDERQRRLPRTSLHESTTSVLFAQEAIHRGSAGAFDAGSACSEGSRRDGSGASGEVWV